MTGLIIGNDNRIYNKSNTTLMFEISQPIEILAGDAHGSPNNLFIEVDQNGGDLTKEPYEIRVKQTDQIENIMLRNDGKISINSPMLVTKPTDLTFAFNVTVTKHLCDYYDDMIFTYNGYIVLIRINGEESNEYEIINAKISINKNNRKLRMSNNVIEIITCPSQAGRVGYLEYDGYPGVTFEENMFSSFSVSPENTETELGRKKVKGLRGETMQTSSGGTISIQLYSYEQAKNYEDIGSKRFRIHVINDHETTTYHNCHIKFGSSSVEDEVNNKTYEIKYGYKTFEEKKEDVQ